MWDDKRAGAVWNDFKNVKHRKHYIYWGKGLQQYEFETRELWREGKPLPVGEDVLDAPLTQTGPSGKFWEYAGCRRVASIPNVVTFDRTAEDYPKGQ